MTPEQQKAADLAAEIGKLGGYVVSVVPPGMDDLVIRFQVLADDDDKIMSTLREWGWQPARIGSGPRFDPLGGTVPCNSYAIRIPIERTPVQR